MKAQRVSLAKLSAQSRSLHEQHRNHRQEPGRNARPPAGFVCVLQEELMPDANFGLEKKRSDEKRLVSEMIALYCRRQHHTPRGRLCPECQELHDYARIRIDRCPFMESKTFCSACKVHCYKPEMREKIRVVMRWSGPRMLPIHPILSLKHVAVTLKAKREARK